MRGATASRLPVREVIRDRWRFERRSNDLAATERVALVAQWSRSATMSRSVCTLVRELQDFGYSVVVSSACEASADLEWSHGVHVDRLTVIRKPNVGYDFGSWSLAMAALPEVIARRRVLLANDSMVGPFTSLAPLLQELDATPADVWGLTDSYQFGHHLQSYFLGFCEGALAERPLREFWAQIRHEADKDEVIHRYELGLSRLLNDEGYVRAVAFPHELAVAGEENQVVRGWRQLLERGFPFVKREVLRDPHVAPGGASVPLVIRRMFGVDVQDWQEGAAQ